MNFARGFGEIYSCDDLTIRPQAIPAAYENKAGLHVVRRCCHNPIRPCRERLHRAMQARGTDRAQRTQRSERSSLRLPGNLALHSTGPNANANCTAIDANANRLVWLKLTRDIVRHAWEQAEFTLERS